MEKAERGTTFYGSLIIFQCLLWGLGNTLTKVALIEVPPFYFLAIRFLIAFLLFGLIFGKNILQTFKRDQLTSTLVIGLFTAGSFIFSNLALLLTTATITGFLMSLTVVFTPIMSFFLFRHRVSKKIIFIVIVVVAGLYLLCANDGKFVFGMGEVYAILTAITGAGMLIYSARHVKHIGPTTLSTIQTLVCAVISVVFAVILEDFGALADISTTNWLIILYGAVFSTGIAWILQNVALRKLSATFVALAFCTEPIFTAISAYFFLGETLSLFGFLGCGLIIAGLISASLMPDGTGKAEPATGKKEKRAVGK